MFEQNSPQLLKYIKRNIFARELEFTERKNARKLLFQQMNSNNDKYQNSCRIIMLHNYIIHYKCLLRHHMTKILRVLKI